MKKLLSLALAATLAQTVSASTKDWTFVEVGQAGVPVANNEAELLRALAQHIGTGTPGLRTSHVGFTSFDEPGSHVFTWQRRMIKLREVRVAGTRVFLYRAQEGDLGQDELAMMTIEGRDLHWLWDRVRATLPLSAGARGVEAAFLARLDAEGVAAGEKAAAAKWFRRGLYPNFYELDEESPARTAFEASVAAMSTSTPWSFGDESDGKELAERALALLGAAVETHEGEAAALLDGEVDEVTDASGSEQYPSNGGLFGF